MWLAVMIGTILLFLVWSIVAPKAEEVLETWDERMEQIREEKYS